MSGTATDGKRWVGAVVYAVVLVLPLALLLGGGWLLVQRATGTHARATVTSCETTYAYKSYSQHCTGSWSVDGHPVVGTVQGADPGDVDHTIDVTLHGDEAVSTSLVLPVVLIALGLPLLALIVWPRLRGGLRRPPASP